MLLFWLFISPVYRKINFEKKALRSVHSEMKNTIFQQDINPEGYVLVANLSTIATSLGLQLEATVSQGAVASYFLIHIKARGDYSQLLSLLRCLGRLSKKTFIASFSMLAVRGEESAAALEMDANLGVFSNERY